VTTKTTADQSQNRNKNEETAMAAATESGPTIAKRTGGNAARIRPLNARARGTIRVRGETHSPRSVDRG